MAGGDVYVDSQAGVYALTTGGHALWTYSPHSPIDVTPAVADGTVFVATQNQAVYSLMAPTSP